MVHDALSPQSPIAPHISLTLSLLKEHVPSIRNEGRSTLLGEERWNWAPGSTWVLLSLAELGYDLPCSFSFCLLVAHERVNPGSSCQAQQWDPSRVAAPPNAHVGRGNPRAQPPQAPIQKPLLPSTDPPGILVAKKQGGT